MSPYPVDLSRATITAASRVMLPAYVITFAWIGLGWVLADPLVTASTPALNYVDGFAPLPLWGALLLLVAVGILAAMLSRRRLLCRVALWTALLVMAVFVVVFLFAFARGQATFSAAAWPFLAACACYASDRSLLKGEVS